MSILGKKQDDGDDDLGGDSVTLPLEDMVCATCGRDLAPWMTTCPDDGGAAVDRTNTMIAGVPDVPLHLLQGLDDEVSPPSDGSDREEGGAG